MSTMPGLPMFAHGQIEGFSERYGMEFSRSKWNEKENNFLIERHKREIFPILNGRLTGSATVKASLEPGDYEVRLDDGFGGEAAVVELKVAYPGFTIKAKLRGEAVDAELVVNSNQ